MLLDFTGTADYNIGNILRIVGELMNSIDVLNMIDPKHALFGMFFAFHNRLQTAGDAFYEEITVKQFFLMACMNLFQGEAPTVRDLAQVMGSSHQNVKQILIKLEKKGFVEMSVSENDKRKRIVTLTEKAMVTASKYRDSENEFLRRLYDGVSDEEVRNTYIFLSK